MKKIFTLFLALVATTALWAEDFEVDGIYYNILADKTNEVEVTYRGGYYDSYSNEYSGSVTIPSTVTYNGITCSVTSIGAGAFGECSGLTSVTIGNSVTSIGEYAFFGCSGLTSVVWNAENCADFSNSSYAPFYDIRSQITSFTFGEDVKHIPAYLCYGMSKLTSITIPNSVTSIGNFAFRICSGLTSVTIGNSVTSIGERAFYNCSSLPVENNLRYADTYLVEAVDRTLSTYSIKEGTKWIGEYAFDGCSGLTSVTIPNSVTSIGERAFYYCYGLKSIEIPNSVTSIGDNAFYYCRSLTSITIPNSVTSIGEYAFYNCRSLTSITIPNSVTSLGESAFHNCSGLTSIIVEEGNSIYDSRENCNAIIETNSNTLVAGCKNTTIPNSVTSIGDYAFQGCSALTSITIPNSVTSIGNYAFDGCSGLTSVTIGNSVISIGESAFRYCSGLTSVIWNAENYADFSSYSYAPFYTLRFQITSFTFGEDVKHIPAYMCYGMSKLTSVTIPNSVTSIGDEAFWGCFGLTSVTIPNSVTSIGNSAFYNCSGLTSPIYNAHWFVYMPTSYRGAYAIPEGIKQIAGGAFSSCFGLTSVTIPNSVTSIGNSAFYWCSGLTSVTIGNSVTSIGERAFYECSGLTSITIPNSVTSIGDEAFSSCSSLTSITIPNSVTSIGDEAFSSCSSLTSVYVWAEVPPILGTDVFYNVSKQKPVYVPCGSVSAYQSVEGWNKFTNIQEPLAEYSITVGVNDNKMGTAKVDYNTYCEGAQITAIPNYGYHFVQWSDGITENPRTIVLTQDTTLTAEFALNQYAITTTSSQPERGTTQGDATVNYLEYVTIFAEANYGYYFTQWNDGNTDNPRTVQVTENKNYTAYFAKNTYSITKNCNSEQGYINGISSAKYLDHVTLTAIPNYGYHFTQWSDGIKDNPRTFTLTQDTVFSAEFALNQYTITTTSSQPDRGTIQGNATLNYLEYATIFAEANYGYHFENWNDGNTDNPRSVLVTEDKTYTAYFGKNTYSVTKNYDSTMGTVEGMTSAQYKDQITLTASPIFGYEFVRWLDGNTANPRTFTLTQDTAFTAEFAQSFSGQCGDNLYWAYDENNKTISITGSGDMYDYTKATQPWLLFQEQITEVTTSNTTTGIGTSAFAGCIRLGKVSLGSGMENIAANAFAECKKLYDIYSYAEVPPTANESSFTNYNAYLYIPCESQRYYKADMVFSKFYNQECISSDKVDTEAGTVVVEPSTNDVTITWPTEENANTYSIVITKDSEVFCSLTFNADGQLLNIAFAPSRSGSHPVTYAASTGNGLRFTVTSLEESTTYGYDITTKDAKDNTLSTYTGEFTTKSNVSTSVSDIQSPMTDCQKLLRNGQLIILRDGVEYNAQGQIVKE